MDLFVAKNPPITLRDLQDFETSTGLLLPGDYKTHLLMYNGAETESTEVYFGEPDDGINFFYFHPMKHGSTMLMGTRDYLPAQYISIGCTQTGYLAMSLNEDNYGSIHVYYSEVELTWLAPSFTAFVSGLADYPDWIQ